jgi:hypothetical protein
MADSLPLIWSHFVVLLKSDLDIQQTTNYSTNEGSLVLFRTITGQIFDVWHISAKCISAPKGLKVVVSTNIFFCSKKNLFLELRHVSLR